MKKKKGKKLGQIPVRPAAMVTTAAPSRLWIQLEVKAERDRPTGAWRYAIWNPKKARALEWSLPLYRNSAEASAEGLSYLRMTYFTGRLA